MIKRIFDYDPMTGAIEWFIYDESTDEWCIQRTCDVTPVIENNKRQLTDGTNGWVDKEKEINHIADIPVDVMYTWMTRYGVRAWDKNHAKKVRALLDDSEWRYLRTSELYLGKH